MFFRFVSLCQDVLSVGSHDVLSLRLRLSDSD
jgi:hypothetical protein